jgi:hypothetical protein
MNRIALGFRRGLRWMVGGQKALMCEALFRLPTA